MTLFHPKIRNFENPPLLVARAYEQAHVTIQQRNIEIKDILTELHDVINSKRHASKAIVWNKFYNPNVNKVKQVIARHRSLNGAPILVDPANPTLNLTADMSSWLGFQTRFNQLMRLLKLNHLVKTENFVKSQGIAESEIQAGEEFIQCV